MDIIKLIEYLQEIIETAKKVPMSGKVMVSKSEILEVTEEIMNSLPDEFKKAQWLVQEKERILGDALKQAETIKTENIETLKRQIENHDITIEAKARGEEIITAAQKDAKALRLGARDYAEEVLTELEKEMMEQKQHMIEEIKVDFEKYMINTDSFINETAATLRENVKELKKLK